MSFFKRKISKSPQHQPGVRQVGTTGTRRASQTSNSSRETDVLESNGQFDKASGNMMGRDPTSTGARPRVLLLKPEDSKSTGSTSDTPLQTSSRLSKTFHEVMHDTSATQCLLQYLHSHRLGHLLQFWLDAQSFQAATWSRLQTHSQSTQGHKISSENIDRGDVDKGGGVGEHNERVNVQYQVPCDNRVKNDDPRLLQTSDAQKCTPCNREQSPQTNRVAGDIPTSNSSNISPLSSSQITKNDRTKGDNLTHTLTKDSTLQTCNTVPADNLSTSASSLGTATSVSIATAGNLGDSQSDTPSSSELNQSSSTGSQTDVTSGTETDQKKESFQEKLMKSIENDAVVIYAKYISIDASHPIGISEKLRGETIRGICRDDGQVDPKSFVPCQEYVLDIVHKEHYKDYVQSWYYCKHQIDVLTATNATLADILYNESAIVYFMEYMEQEQAMSLLQCWLELDSFQQHLASQQGQYDPQQAQNDAMVIYEKYFSLQASVPLGFEDDIRFEVECNICREEGPLPECFGKPKRILLRTIDKVYFQLYVKSDHYYKYLSDLISTVQTAQDLPPIRRKRTESDTSSEKSLASTGSENVSISTKNTLLATDTSGFKKAINKINDDMRIDGALFNPDSLWKRDQAGKMSLGKVNSLGQFISEFDPEPDQDRKKKGSFFKKKKEKEKEQEQMAIQIAQMIVSEITTVTSQERGAALVSGRGIGKIPES